MIPAKLHRGLTELQSINLLIGPDPSPEGEGFTDPPSGTLKNSRAAKAALVSPHEKLEERTSKLLHEFIGLFSSVQHAEQPTASI
jgi:hypothetical protein